MLSSARPSRTRAAPRDDAPALRDVLRDGAIVEHHAPWPRAIVSVPTWEKARRALASGGWTLLGLWAEPTHVHMAVLDHADDRFGVLSIACARGQFPSIGRAHPPAMRLERTIRDLWHLEARGSPDVRPWLDHGTWKARFPDATRGRAAAAPQRYAFLPCEGESLHEIAVGPVHAGIIEPGHFRFTANGEAVVRLEARLGYVHKGIESLIAGASLQRAAALAGRASGDSTVAYALAFAQAVEHACGIEVPARAVWLRALMAELERLANHFGDIGAICNDAAFAMMHAQCGDLREHVLRAAQRCFGHRLMMDQIAPGGVRNDLPREGPEVLRELLATIRKRFPELVELYDNTASLQDRTVGTGVLAHELARQFGAGGYVGRASGRGFDARRAVRYPPYDVLQFESPVLEEGDVNARVWIRIREVEQSASLVEQILYRLPSGAVAVPSVATREGEGLALVEGFRGDVLAWVRTGPEATVERCHLRDPSCFQWPLLEAVIEGNIVADFPLCNKSFNCSYSGHDL